MAFYTRSLSEDSIDHYSHSWASLFLIVCAAISVIPNASTTWTQTPGQKIHLPKYKTTCWMPEMFTQEMVVYAEDMCSSAVNDLVKGRTPTAAQLVEILDEPVIPLRVPKSRIITPKEFHRIFLSREDSPQRNGHNSKDNLSWQTLKDRLQFDIQDLGSYRAPLYLFLFAICLILPAMIHTILSLCFGCVNVAETLKVAQSILSGDDACQQEKLQAITVAFGQARKAAAGILYLLMKFLMIIVLGVEIVVISNSLLADTAKLENDFEVVKNIEAKGISQGPATQGGVICDFSIHQMTSVRTFSVQCALSIAETKDSTATSQAISSSSPSEWQEGKVLLLYKALFTVVLAALVVLVVFNFFSLVGWLSKLMLSSCRRSLGLKPEATVDEVFLISMAWHNTSAVVAVNIAQNFARRENSDRLKKGNVKD